MARKHRPTFTVHDATRHDTADFLSLLAPADPGNPAPYDYARHVLASRPGGPLTHGRYLCLIARTTDGNPIGALAAGPPRWFFEHDATRHDENLVDVLVARFCAIGGVAVHPGHRGSGIGTTLIRHAERRCARAGYGVLGMDHTPPLEPYFAGLGYTAGPAVILNLPDPLPLFAQQVGDSLISTKPLERRVRLQSVPGLPAPVICGLLPRTHLRPGTFFLAGRLCEPAG
ncbi:GNAT family N-acetyltransferase [Kitasatospora sp. NPDC056783]|uniref:GNAT family N-acetyltransferase n=1 Tax=Kitasatospora sp. NPDC056783 TaxID=3345943 RepID=UPI00369E913B